MIQEREKVNIQGTIFHMRMRATYEQNQIKKKKEKEKENKQKQLSENYLQLFGSSHARRDCPRRNVTIVKI